MTDARLSSATKALLGAAKMDGPHAAARAKVWAGVSKAIDASGGGSPSSAPHAAAGGASAAKMLALGTLLGTTLTVGLAAMLLRIAPTPSVPAPYDTPARLSRAPESPSPRPATAILTSISTATPTSTSTSTATPPRPRSHISTANPLDRDDELAREASLVGEARGALARGDARAALAAVRAAQALRSRQLVPEELAVQAQALRALGRRHDATEVDETLRSEYPESALAR